MAATLILALLAAVAGSATGCWARRADIAGADQPGWRFTSKTGFPNATGRPGPVVQGRGQVASAEKCKALVDLDVRRLTSW